MQALLRCFLDICLLRLGPQDLPASGFLETVALGAYALVGILVSLTSEPAGIAVVAALTDTALLIGVVRGGLLLARRPERSRQTLSALAGAGSLLGLLSLPLLSLYYATQDGAAGMFSTLILLLMVWNTVVVGHIARHALSVPLPAGIALALLYMILSYQVMGLLFGPAGGQG